MATGGFYAPTLIERATFEKTWSQNINIGGGVAMTWDNPAIRNTVQDLAWVSATEFSIGIGSYFVSVNLVPTLPGALDRVGLVFILHLNGIGKPERSISDILDAGPSGPFSAHFNFIVDIPLAGTLLTIESGRTKQVGIVNSALGSFINFLRLS